MTLVVRREGDQLRRYVHLGTGNYHHSTAKVYTDYGYMSSEKKLGQDVHKIFMQLTSLTEARDLNLMLTSPFNLFDGVMAKIGRETENARAGRKAHIIVKVNSLNEPHVIDALYEASQAGVKIELIVRGICTLRPGVLGLSDNITVRSILGRFLEHSRVYYFHNDGDEEIRRNESCFPVRQKTLKEQLKRDLELYLADNCNAWVLHGDGSYERLVPGDREPVSAQETLTTS
jgi:polyphosphate kinase